jgi:uncharacterized protein with PIN domain
MAQLTGNANLQRATFRFHGRLATLMSRAGSDATFPLNGRIAIKHPIEALGIPHTEVETILANGYPVDFSYIVRAGDEINVYPAASGVAKSSVRLRPSQPYPPRFVADNHLGRLVTYLRLLGFDTLHPKHLDDAELAELSSLEQRVLLTRDRRLLMRKIVVYGFCLQTRESRQQLLDVLDRFDLRQAITPWHRCLRCNGQLGAVAKEDILECLEFKTKKYYHEFHMCQECRQIYWKGSHYRPLLEFITTILDRP